MRIVINFPDFFLCFKQGKSQRKEKALGRSVNSNLTFTSYGFRITLWVLKIYNTFFPGVQAEYFSVRINFLCEQFMQNKL